MLYHINFIIYMKLWKNHFSGFLSSNCRSKSFILFSNFFILSFLSCNCYSSFLRKNIWNASSLFRVSNVGGSFIRFLVSSSAIAARSRNICACYPVSVGICFSLSVANTVGSSLDVNIWFFLTLPNFYSYFLLKAIFHT